MESAPAFQPTTIPCVCVYKNLGIELGRDLDLLMRIGGSINILQFKKKLARHLRNEVMKRYNYPGHWRIGIKIFANYPAPTR